MKKIKISIFVINLLFISCDFQNDDYIEPTNGNSYNSNSLGPCNLNCDMWYKCSSRQVNPNSWWGPREWFCENVFVKYYTQGEFQGDRIKSSNNGSIESDHIHVDVGYPSLNNLNLTIQPGHNFNERYDILISFLDDSSGSFTVNTQNVYIHEFEANTAVSGDGSFTKNGSSASYTVILDLEIYVDSVLYDFNILASSQYGYYQH